MNIKFNMILWIIIGGILGCETIQETPIILMKTLKPNGIVSIGAKISIVGLAENVTIMVQNSYETYVISTNVAKIEFKYAGRYIFTLLKNKQILDQKVYIVQAGNVKNTNLLVGAKAIVADGESIAMAILIPEDRYKNISLKPTEFRAMRPSKNTEIEIKNPYHLIVYKTIISQTLAGKTLVNAKIQNQESIYREITEVAGNPINFTLSVEKMIPFADDTQFFTIKTDILRDKFGNIVEDGTLIELELRELNTNMNNQERFLTAYTLGGIATWFIKNPKKPGMLQTEANAIGTKSNSLLLIFQDKNQSKVLIKKP